MTHGFNIVIIIIIVLTAMMIMNLILFFAMLNKMKSINDWFDSISHYVTAILMQEEKKGKKDIRTAAYELKTAKPKIEEEELICKNETENQIKIYLSPTPIGHNEKSEWDYRKRCKNKEERILVFNAIGRVCVPTRQEHKIAGGLTAFGNMKHVIKMSSVKTSNKSWLAYRPNRTYYMWYRVKNYLYGGAGIKCKTRMISNGDSEIIWHDEIFPLSEKLNLKRYERSK